MNDYYDYSAEIYHHWQNILAEQLQVDFTVDFMYRLLKQANWRYIQQIVLVELTYLSKMKSGIYSVDTAWVSDIVQRLTEARVTASRLTNGDRHLMDDFLAEVKANYSYEDIDAAYKQLEVLTDAVLG
jgi:predicted nucleic acid-binding protein